MTAAKERMIEEGNLWWQALLSCKLGNEQGSAAFIAALPRFMTEIVTKMDGIGLRSMEQPTGPSKEVLLSQRSTGLAKKRAQEPYVPYW